MNEIEKFILENIIKSPEIMSTTIAKYVSLIERTNDLSQDIEIELIKKAKYDNDIEAKKELFNSFIKLVFGVAKKYITPAISFEDLVQEGIIGLEEALEHFDLDRKCRFSTLAKWWIKARILKYVRENMRGFSIPTETTSKIFSVAKCIESLSKDCSHVPSNKEIGDELGIHESHISFLRKFLTHSISLDEEISSNRNEGDISLKDLITDDRNNAQESLIRNDGILLIKLAISKLTTPQKFVIENRYGINCNDCTLQEIGKKLNLSTERIRQIQNEAEKKLKHAINR